MSTAKDETEMAPKSPNDEPAKQQTTVKLASDSLVPPKVYDNPNNSINNNSSDVDVENEPPMIPDKIRIPSTFTGFLWEVLVGGEDSQSAMDGQQQSDTVSTDTAGVPSAIENAQTEQTGLGPAVPAVFPTSDKPAMDDKTDQHMVRVKSAGETGILSTIWDYSSALLNVVSPISPETTSEQDRAESERSAGSNYSAAKVHVGDTLVEPESSVVGFTTPLFSAVDSSPDFVREPINLLNVDSGDQLIFSDQWAYQEIRSHLPKRLQYCTDWSLIFSLDKHGISLRTFYDKVNEYCEEIHGGNHVNCPTVLIIRDDKGNIFGAFTMEMWRPNSGSGTARELTNSNALYTTAAGKVSASRTLLRGASSRSFYGTGETFIFGLNQQEHSINVYQWTYKNDYFQLSELDFIAIGGGDGKFSLFLDGDFYQGSCDTAPTFDNQHPLSGKDNTEFICVTFELWGIDPC